MRSAILEKLDKFLGTHIPFKEECEAVYLMVELRKLLDRKREEREKTDKELFPLIRCYSDWAVHTAKDGITRPVKDVMNRISELLNTNGTPYPKNNNTDFLFLPELRAEMAQLFNEYCLPATLCSDESAWKHFLSVFVQVLADQPMKEPIPAISSFCFVLSSPGHLKVKITFTNSRPPFERTTDIF